MEILLMLIFISMVFAACAALGFAYSVRAGEAKDADRIATLPIRSDEENT